MSIETRSTKRNRVYQRKFDHDEARTRHAAGSTVTELAREYGVSFSAVDRIVSPRRAAQMKEQTRRYVMSATCAICGKEGVSIHNRGGRGRLCLPCANAERSTSTRADALQCARCRKWLPDDAFPRNRSETGVRRGRHSLCRSCSTEVRSEYRNRGKVSCEGGCGRKVEGAGRANSRTTRGGREQLDPDRPFLCRDCAQQKRRRTEEENMASGAGFVVLVEDDTDTWKVYARVNAQNRRDALNDAFKDNGGPPSGRVVVISDVVWKPGRAKPVTVLDLEID